MLEAESYTAIVALFPRFLGAIYFFAFGAFLFQIKGLLGMNGILPVSQYLEWIERMASTRRFFLVPSLFWLNCSDRALTALVATGTLLSLLLMCGVCPSLLLFLLYLLYLSLFSVGQDFLSFGWEVFLQEITLNAFLMSVTTVPNTMVWISLNLLLFRFHLQAGAVKLQSRDPTWRNLTAIAYHYQSQPIPNTLAWYMHKLPMWFHKLSCLLMFFAELVVPFFIFFGEELRLFVCAILVGLQLVIWLTGNFSYLNHLTVVFCTILLNNKTLGIAPPPALVTPWALDVLLTGLGSCLVILQLLRLWDHFFPNVRFRKILRIVEPFHLANRYGIFAVMTTIRSEVVVEGSMDGVEWKEYLFYHKPSALKTRPKRISPYQPRLDWQAWFLPFQRFEREEWFQSFLVHLLKGTPEVVRLIRHTPFLESPPHYVRALVYVYEFTSRREKKETRNWWKRKLVGRYSTDLSFA